MPLKAKNQVRESLGSTQKKEKKVKLLPRMFALTLAIVLLAACAAPAAPTAAPTKPAAAGGASPVATAVAPAGTAAPAATKPAAAATAPTATPAAKIKRGGNIRVAQQFDYPTMDIHLASTVPTCLHMIYEDFLGYHVDPKTGMWGLTPGLAESWAYTDPTTVVMRLQKGVKFHDGSDFNAEIAKWNIDRMTTNAKSYAKLNTDFIKVADVVDANTVKLTLKQPSAIGMAMLTKATSTAGIVSKAAVEKMGDDEFGRKGVGTGPMELVEWRPSDHVTVKKFNNYWAKGADGQPLPYLDGAVCRFRPDLTVSLVELKAGDLDFLNMIDPKDVAGVKADPRFDYVVLAGGDGRAVGMNQSFGPFADNLKLRQAVLYSIDREAMAKTLLFGSGGPAEYFWTKGQPGYDDKLPKYTYDPAKAKQLMNEAGLPNGIEALFSFISRPVDQRVAEMVQSMLKPTGIRLNLEALERLAWIEKISRSKKFEMSVWIYSLDFDPTMKIRRMSCRGTDNWGAYCNPKFDQCMDEGDQILDPAKRHEIYKRCQTIFFEDGYWTLVANFVKDYVKIKALKGVGEQWSAFDWEAAWLDK
jgi:ABC-type transport system substrate-binding protein